MVFDSPTVESKTIYPPLQIAFSNSVRLLPNATLNVNHPLRSQLFSLFWLKCRQLR